jgi:hypothetical protein
MLASSRARGREQRDGGVDSNLHPLSEMIYPIALALQRRFPHLGDGEVLWLSGKRGGANEGKGGGFQRVSRLITVEVGSV